MRLNSIRFDLFFVSIISLSLDGCGVPQFLNTIEKPHGISRTLYVTTHVTPGGIRTQAFVKNYTKGSIAHAVLTVFEIDGSNESPVCGADGKPVTVDITGSELASPIEVRNLITDTHYRIKISAYKAESTTLNDKISIDAASFADITVPQSDKLLTVSIPVKLMDFAFSAKTNPSPISIVNGGFASTGSINIGGQNGVQLTTIAGTSEGFHDGEGISATFNNPCSVAQDSKGNIYIADTWNQRIRKIDTSGRVGTFAGNGIAGSIDGNGFDAEFNAPFAITVDRNDNILVADSGNNRVRKITPNGNVATLAGTGAAGADDGPAAESSFDYPAGIAANSAGDVFVCDLGNNKIRMISSQGTVTTIAGTGDPGYLDGPGNQSLFNSPCGIAVEVSGNLVVADSWNNRIRDIDLRKNEVSTLAGNGTDGFLDGPLLTSEFSTPTSVAIDSQNRIYVADSNNNAVRQLSANGIVATILGNGYGGFGDGKGLSAYLYSPFGIFVSNKNELLIADTLNNRIRAARLENQ